MTRHVWTSRPLVALASFATVVAGGALHAQQRTVGSTITAPITLDFLAVDANGAPVTDLKPADISLKISGRDRTIQSLQLVKMAPPAAAAAPTPAPSPTAATPAAPGSTAALPPPFGTNAHATVAGSGRAIFLVIDNESIRPSGERAVRDAVEPMLAALSPGDEVALVTVPHGGVNIELTSDLSKIRAGLDEVRGTAPGGESVADATARSRSTLLQFETMMEALQGIERPTTFVLVSTSLLGPQAVGGINQTQQANGSSAINSLNDTLMPEDFDHVGPDAAGARANVYVVQPEGGSRPVSAPGSTGSSGRGASAATSADVNPTTGLQSIAGGSGGVFLQMALSNESAFARIAQETSAYYVATIESTPEDRTGTTHSVSLKTSRPNVTLRTPPSLYGSKAAATTAAKPVTPDDMIKTRDAFRDLPLRVTGFAVRKPGDKTGDKMTLQVMAEPVDPSVHFNALTFALVDPTTHKALLYRAQSAQLSTSPVIGLIEAAPGKYRLRAAATDATGRAGAADLDIDTALATGGPFKLSDIGLGVTTQGHFVQEAEFSNQPEATAYCELYGGAANQPLALSVELAKTPDGPPLDLDIKAQAGGTNEPDKFSIVAAIPIASLAPGDYVVRVKFGVAGNQGVVIRTLRKVAQ